MKKRIIGKADNILSKEFYVAGYGLSGRRVVTHPLFSGSAIMILGSNFANFIAYIYHLVLGRMLGPSAYGEFAATLSLIGMFTVTFSFFGLVIVKFISSAKKSEHHKMLTWFLKKAAVLGLVMGGIALVSTPVLSNFLKIDFNIIILVGPILFLSVVILVFRAFFQGTLNFNYVVILTIFEMVLRLGFGVLLVVIGWSVFGVIFGLLLSLVVSLALSRYMSRNYKLLGVDSKGIKGKKVIVFALPVFVMSIANISFFSTDLLLVKHFFNSYNAGIYASMSALGKIIFFGTAPISAVMFPLISKRHARGQDYKKILLISTGLVSVVAMAVILVYYILPELMVKILYGDEFIEASRNLAWFGLFMGVFSITTVISNYFLSIEKTRVAYLVLAAAIVQAVGIWLFNDSLLTVIHVSVIASSLLLAGLLIYLVYEQKDAKRKKIPAN